MVFDPKLTLKPEPEPLDATRLAVAYLSRVSQVQRDSGQGYPHAKPALKCVVRDVAYILSWHWRHAGSKPLASAWLPSGVVFYLSETRGILGCSSIHYSHHEKNAGWRCGDRSWGVPIKWRA
ncbi:unnamed protein product [Penicillium camemberti]|uniref:Str. FM013 n=1 Tax=Penicillium camemberti (strain FM 013) TaxID=1429867 RepID=A0A0G4PBZ1_PENC3|nr:unnamed protein product [Penicillium camemberti]